MTKERQKVLFVTGGVFPHSVGGMERHSACLIRALADTGSVDIHVVHPHDRRVFESDSDIHEIPVPFDFNGFYLKKCYEYSILTDKLIRKHTDALVYAQGLSVIHGLNKTGNRVIVNPHGLEPFQGLSFSEKLKTYPFRKLERYQFKHAARVVSLGGRLTDILSKEMKKRTDRIVTLPNAVEPVPPIDRNFEGSVIKLLFVGRFAFNKGINILMEAMRQLNKEGYEKRIELHLVGKGPLFDTYTKEYNLPNTIFHGFTDDEQLNRLYEQCDLFVFPTLFEGMPTVVLEAMVRGLPVVVSDTGATAELTDSSTGFLIEANNIRALKWAVQQFYQLPPEQKKMLSIASRRKVMERFTWKQVAAKHLELFSTFRP